MPTSAGPLEVSLQRCFQANLDLVLQSLSSERLDDGAGRLGCDLDLLAEHVLDACLRRWLLACLDHAQPWDGEFTCLDHLLAGNLHEGAEDIRASLLLQAVFF